MLIRQRQFLLAWVLFTPALVPAEIVFPELTGRVVDNADLLSESLEDTLTRQLRAHEQKTTNQVVVVTVPSLQGANIERFGRDLGNHWGIGHKDKDNGVLLIVAPSERKVRIEVGIGLESKLSNIMAQNIINLEIIPLFRKSDYAEGIRDGTETIIAALEGRYEPRTSSIEVGRRKANGGPSIVGFLVFPFIVLVFLLGKVSNFDFGLEFGNGTGGDLSGEDFSGGGGSFGGGGASGSW